VIQSAYYLCHGNRCYHDGPWDEDLLWLYGADALHQPTTTPPRYNFQASYGGYYTLRDPSGFVFLRCATLFHRPSQADMLHLDLWWNGQNIALDAGTYSYNAPDPWNNTLAHTICHNTVTVDNTDQMERLSKFFWAPWIQSQVCKYKQFTQNTLAYWEGEHFGYIRLAQPVCYRRGVLQLGQGWWLVLDGLRSNALHKYQLHWLFPDVPYTWDSLHGNITLQTSAGLYYASMGVFNQPAKFSLAIAEETSPNGWRAPRYTSREPAISVTMETFSEEALFWTLFGPKPSSLTKHRESLSIDTIDWNATITTNLDIPHHPLLAAISATGLIKHYS
jgi:hypothetical protein